MNRAWLPFLIGGGLAAGVLLVAALVSLIRGLGEGPPLAEARVVPEQTVVLDATGPVLLHIEGPQLTTRFQGLRYVLIRRETGSPVPGRSVLFRERRTGLTRARLSIQQFALEAPGPHVLRVEGLRPDVDYADCRILFTPDRRAGFALWLATRIVGIVLGLGGVLVATILSVVILGRGARP